MWRVYKHTGKYNDYDVYKEALNAARCDVSKSTRNCEHPLAQHIKSYSKSWYAYLTQFNKIVLLGTSQVAADKLLAYRVYTHIF